jgi:hypothetical protein
MMDELNSLLTGFRQHLVERDTPELRILFALGVNPRKYGPIAIRLFRNVNKLCRRTQTTPA